MTNEKTTIGVIFGGRSVEHDVSIVTGHQVMRAMNYDKFDVVPIYISRSGGWYTGAPLMDLKNYQVDITDLIGIQEVALSPSTDHHGLIVNPGSGFLRKSRIIELDVVFPALHGSHGEDGTVQGLLELANIPYVGCGVLASAIANDKIMSKLVLKQFQIPVIDAVSFSRAEWEQDSDKVMEQATVHLTFPLFVKPATLGSSIAISKAVDNRTLRDAIDLALRFDDRVLVEKSAENSIEINCAVMGSGYKVRASILEQPVSYNDFLDFADKYLQGSGGMKGAERQIPAPIDENLAAQIQTAAVQAFQAIEGSGTARMDFLVRPESGEFYVNEINTMPGSVGVYLWQEDGHTAQAVVEELIHIAQSVSDNKNKNLYDYKTNLVELTAERGLKGAKGTKGTKR
ncbi:MAG: D-alanine--D-alanine ligase family protein [Chloroflexota bacterium]